MFSDKRDVTDIRFTVVSFLELLTLLIKYVIEII